MATPGGDESALLFSIQEPVIFVSEMARFPLRWNSQTFSLLDIICFHLTVIVKKLHDFELVYQKF
jgi:hypothetical protein